MIQFRIYNSDRLRGYSYFPKSKDPNMLEHTLLRLVNERLNCIGMPMKKVFDIKDKEISNMYFTYYTISNPNIWGMLPMGYIYNDMVRHIQSVNTPYNFTFTMESVYVEIDESDSIALSNKMYTIYDIVNAYIVENYMTSYSYMDRNAKGILVSFIPKGKDTIAYIMSVGFDPMTMAKWYSSSQDSSDPNAIPLYRYMSLDTIVKTYESRYGVRLGPIEFECNDSRLDSNYYQCIDGVMKCSIDKLKKKSLFDTEVKYGNYYIDYGLLSMFDSSIPACTVICMDGNEKIDVTLFNQETNFKDDFRILKKQNDIRRVAKKNNKGEA